MSEIKIVKKQISELKPAPYNPRIMGEPELEKLKKSLREFGYVDPLIWNIQTGYVVGGNQRLEAMNQINAEDTKNGDKPTFKEISVVEVDLSLTKEKALNIALNRITGEWDYDKLTQILGELNDEESALTGFDDIEISTLLQDMDEFTPPRKAEGEEGEGTLNEETGEPQTTSAVIYLSFKEKVQAEAYLLKNFNMTYRENSYQVTIDMDAFMADKK